MDELTFDEKYNIEVNLIVDSFSCQYHECGSHQLKIKAILELEELQSLYNSIKKIKGIK